MLRSVCAELRASCSLAGRVAALALVAALTAVQVAVAGGPAPTVEAMVVGRGGALLAPERLLAAGPAAVSVDGRTCSVAGGTALAALLALRAQGGPGFSLRDYGHCGGSAANSAELFVASLGGEANRGQDGWEYKVGGAAGATGAADPSGPSGDGRAIRAGERVLWFWCEASAGGCQRTLEVSASVPVTAGKTVTATVYGYDNEGRGVPVSGATVALGGRRAVTTSRGHASLVAPSRPGRYALTATRPGMVPAFPVTIVVG